MCLVLVPYDIMLIYQVGRDWSALRSVSGNGLFVNTSPGISIHIVALVDVIY